jgi:cell division septum initiation protein DivIVA
VYRVFESLDALVTVVEEARGVPMTANCVVPRGDVLELLDDVREAFPGELDDAQDVLDRRDELVDDAAQEAEQTRSSASGRWPGPAPRPSRCSPRPATTPSATSPRAAASTPT